MGKKKKMYKTDGDGNLYEVDECVEEIDYDERDYIKEQNKLRIRYSNRW